MSAFVGSAELAQMLGVSRQRVNQLIATHNDFPEPLAEIAAGRIWSTDAVDAWLARHPDRKPGRAAPTSQDSDLGSLDQAAQHVFEVAERSVAELGHSWMGCEHLLIGLIEVPGPAHDALTRAGIDGENLRASIIATVGQPSGTAKGRPKWTPRIAAAVGIARDLARREHSPVTPVHILRGILDHGANVGCMILVARGIDLLGMRAQLAGLSQPESALDPVHEALARIEARLARIEQTLAVPDEAG